MINTILVDNEKIELDNLANKIKQIGDGIHILGLAKSRREAVDLIMRHLPDLDLIFLDIELDEGDGFALLEEIYLLAEDSDQDCSFEVIFVTAYPKYALDAFRNNGLYFLTKAIDIEELEKAIQLYRDQAQKNSLITHSAIDRRMIIVRKRDTFLRIDPLQVVYLEANGNTTKIYLSKRARSRHQKFYKLKRSEFIIVAMGLKACITKYFRNVDGFIRVHTSYFINIRFLSECSPDYSELSLADDSLLEERATIHRIRTGGQYREAFRVKFNSGRL